jgi:peptide/nickel transport system ATP-binding protein
VCFVHDITVTCVHILRKNIIMTTSLLPVLSLDNVSIHADVQTLVQPVSLQLYPGQTFVLLGESGSGKSLLAQMIMGLLPANLRSQGSITIGQHTSQANAQSSRHALWGKEIALLPQEPWLALDPTMRVEQQIAETYSLVRYPVKDARNTTLRNNQTHAQTLTTNAMQQLGLGDATGKYPYMISGGMAQRVAFLVTHAAGAPVMLIDEPTKGLDANRRDDIVQLLLAARANRIALLVITHDVLLARELGGNAAIMLDGHIVEKGDTTTVLHHPVHPYTKALIAAEPAMWSHQTTTQQRAFTSSDQPVIASISNIGKSFGKQTLFSNISAEIRAGECIAISGPSGSGKTTFGNIVLGCLKPDTGTVKRRNNLPATAFQKLYQDPAAAFSPYMTIGQSIDDLISLHKLNRHTCKELLARLKLTPSLLERLPSQVSGGELQRFALVRILLLQPALIFADEPTSRLDPVMQQETLHLLIRHAKDTNCAVLLVTHDPHIARHLADRQLSLS